MNLTRHAFQETYWYSFFAGFFVIVHEWFPARVFFSLIPSRCLSCWLCLSLFVFNSCFIKSDTHSTLSGENNLWQTHLFKTSLKWKYFKTARSSGLQAEDCRSVHSDRLYIPKRLRFYVNQQNFTCWMHFLPERTFFKCFLGKSHLWEKTPDNVIGHYFRLTQSDPYLNK